LPLAPIGPAATRNMQAGLAVMDAEVHSQRKSARVTATTALTIPRAPRYATAAECDHWHPERDVVFSAVVFMALRGGWPDHPNLTGLV
jgi:hypothetical protein